MHQIEMGGDSSRPDGTTRFDRDWATNPAGVGITEQALRGIFAK
jgi:hypothetical protein